MRWTGTVFMLLVIAVTVRTVWFDHPLNDSIKGFLTDIGYTVLGGGALRKGIEVAGTVFSNNQPSPPNA